MSEIAKDECKKMQLKILSADKTEEIEDELFKVLDQAPLTSTEDATIPISLLLTYITYSTLGNEFSKKFTQFLLRLIHSDSRAIREMSYILISALSKTETLKSIFKIIASQFSTLNHEELTLLLTFAFDFEAPANEPWQALIEPAKSLFDIPAYSKRAHRFVDYMKTIEIHEQEQKKIHAHHKVPASQFTPDFVNENSNTVHQYIHMLRDYDWQIQLKAVEGLTNVIDSHPELLANNAKAALINLIDVIGCPRTMVKSSGLKLAIKLINKYPENTAIHAGKYIEIAFSYCDNTIDFIAKEANEILTSIATKLPRSFVLKDLSEGCHDENQVVRASAAHCFALISDYINKEPVSFTIGEKRLFIGGPLDNNEFYIFVKSMYDLIRDKEEATRTDSRKVMKILMKDPRFTEVSHNIIPSSDDYDMIMSDLAKF